jgi:hypothetical protein
MADAGEADFDVFADLGRADAAGRLGGSTLAGDDATSVRAEIGS